MEALSLHPNPSEKRTSESGTASFSFDVKINNLRQAIELILQTAKDVESFSPSQINKLSGIEQQLSNFKVVSTYTVADVFDFETVGLLFDILLLANELSEPS